MENALGPVAASHLNPRIDVIDGKQVCVVSCDRASAPTSEVEGYREASRGRFLLSAGTGKRSTQPEAANEFVAARFPAAEPLYSVYAGSPFGSRCHSTTMESMGGEL